MGQETEGNSRQVRRLQIFGSDGRKNCSESMNVKLTSIMTIKINSVISGRSPVPAAGSL